jgi:hypothetical protein
MSCDVETIPGDEWLSRNGSITALALLRMRAESPEPATQATGEPDPGALPEAIANLQRKIDSGKSKLDFDEPRGYLHSLLGQLDIPVSSPIAGLLQIQRTALPHISGGAASPLFQ